jgi:hypothetical protein
MPNNCLYKPSVAFGKRLKPLVTLSLNLFLSLVLIFATSATAKPSRCGSLLTKAGQIVRDLSFPKGVMASEMINQSFYKPSDKGAVVGASGYTGTRAQLNAANGRFLSGKPFADNTDVFHIEVSSVGDFFRQLKDVYVKRGSIYKLAIVGHGEPGACALGHESLSLAWTERNTEYLKSLPDDLFAPDAEIVLLSCNCSQGNVFNPNEGVDKVRAIFSKFVRQGGKVVASRGAVFGSVSGFTPSNEVTEVLAEQQDLDKNLRVRILGGVLIPPLLIFYSLENLFNMVLLDKKSKTDIIDIIDIPHQF